MSGIERERESLNDSTRLHVALAFRREDMRNRELNNGRFAMFAIVGIIAAEGATGKDAIEQLGL